jgi:hypothetical protein
MATTISPFSARLFLDHGHVPVQDARVPHGISAHAKGESGTGPKHFGGNPDRALQIFLGEDGRPAADGAQEGDLGISLGARSLERTSMDRNGSRPDGGFPSVPEP